VADRALILEKGRICFDGTLQALIADDSIRRSYLSL
jgi:ABC-type branched-subunit amino acid transport system ATPase component